MTKILDRKPKPCVFSYTNRTNNTRTKCKIHKSSSSLTAHSYPSFFVLFVIISANSNPPHSVRSDTPSSFLSSLPANTTTSPHSPSLPLLSRASPLPPPHERARERGRPGASWGRRRGDGSGEVAAARSRGVLHLPGSGRRRQVRRQAAMRPRVPPRSGSLPRPSLIFKFLLLRRKANPDLSLLASLLCFPEPDPCTRDGRAVAPVIRCRADVVRLLVMDCKRGDRHGWIESGKVCG
jgi:hypothetical protein